jgi:hypothetical protein
MTAMRTGALVFAALVLCGFLDRSSAIAKDQDGIVIFGLGILGCAKHHVAATNEIRVKCNLGSNTVVDTNRKISANCSGIIEGTWRLAQDKIMYTNIHINNNNFICKRNAYHKTFDFDRLATSDLGLHGFSASPASILMTYDSDLEMVCIPEKTPEGARS